MSNTPLPPTPEDEAFSAIENAQKRKVKTYGEAVIWLPEGEYTETMIKDLAAGFDRMRDHQRKALGM
jgi:hypothetical protein